MPLFPPIFPQPVYADPRPEAPAAGTPLTAPEKKRRYIRVPDGQGGWTYYFDTDPQAIGPNGVPAGQVVELPEKWNVGNGYHENPPTPTDAPQPPVAPVAPVRPSTAQNPISPPVQDQGGAGVTTADRPGMGNGPLVRIGGGDQFGQGIVAADSQEARDAIARGVKPVPVLTGLVATPGPGIPPVGLPNELTASGMFDAFHRSLPGASIIGYQANNVPGEGTNSTIPEHKVTWRLPNGVEETITFRRVGQDWAISGAPEAVTTGATSPDKAALEKAQTDYQLASAALQRVQAARTAGQMTEQDLKNAKDAADNAERAFNTAIGRGNVTHDDVVKQGETIARTGLIGAQTVQTQVATEGTAAQTAATLQGTQNQTYQNVLQFYRDQGADEGKAVELTLQYFNNRANVDNTNNTLAVNAAKAQVDAQQGANTQRISLANNRLSQASSGFTEDARAANDINQYLKPGSSKGADAMMALQAMRYANAKKYGAFDVNDQDLRFDPTKLPSGITAFANPSAPSFTSYPTWEEMNAGANGMRGRLGLDNRPAPPNHTNVVQPRAVPTPPPVTQQAPNPAAPRTAAGAVPTPAPTGPPPNASASVAPAPRAAGNERPDDVLTVVGQQDASVMTRSQYEAAKASGALPSGAVVKNAESGTLYDKTPEGNLVRRVLIAPEARPLPGGMTMGGGNSTPTPQERYDDIVTYAVPPDAMNPNGSQVRYYRYQISTPETMQEMQRYGVDPSSPVNAQGRDTYNAQFPEGSSERWEAPAYNPERGETSQVQPVSPAAVAELSQPSQSLAYTNQVLVADPAEEERRRRQRAMSGMFGSPDAIYGIMDGAYPEIPAFY